MYGTKAGLFTATAILDRLLHHSTTLNIKGERYRLKEKRKAVVMTQNNTTISEDGMVKIRLHQCRKYTGWHENGPARGVDIFSPEHPE